MPITVEQAEMEMAKLSKEMAKLEQKRQRYEALKTFVSLGKQLSPNEACPADATATTEVGTDVPTLLRPSRHRTPTGEVAARVLGDVGPLTLEKLVDEMAATGWKVSGIRAKDRKAAYAAVHRDTNRFEQDDDGRWRLKEKVA